MMEGENAPKYGSMFQKYWQAVIQYPGQAREKASAVLGEVVKESGGERFFKKFEQLEQLALCTPKTFNR